MHANSAEYVHTPPGSPGILSGRLLMVGSGSDGVSLSGSVANGPLAPTANLTETDSGSSENEAENDDASDASSVGGLSAMVVPSLTAVTPDTKQDQPLQQHQQRHQNPNQENEAESSSPTLLNPIPTASIIARSSSTSALFSQSTPPSTKRFSIFGFGNSTVAGLVSQRYARQGTARSHSHLHLAPLQTPDR
ncbi:hypothetical protein BC830DRAFT_743446 [Chytriomyces sp. MP71]|nr:hypothetical protein BC830DRAFT_743446 [Chytriomyces sp. MP71]